MKTIAVVQRKGGNGKSTSCLNLARCLSLKGKRVLIVDLDDQKNSTQSIPFENKTAHTVDEVLVNDKLSVKDAVTAASWNGVKVIAESPNLSGVIRELDGEVGSHLVLKEKLDEVKADFDFCLIDTSPSLNILTINALCASDSVLITADTGVFAVVGIGELLKTVQKIKKRVNPKLKVQGILLTMCDNRTNLSKLLTQQVEEMYQGKIAVFKTKIPKTVKVGEAIYSGQSIKKYAKGSSVDIAYDNLAKEICYE